MDDKGISLTILGIVAVIAIVGLVLLFTGAGTGGIIIGQKAPVQTWGKAIRTVSAQQSCFLSSGALGTVVDALEYQQRIAKGHFCEARQTVSGIQSQQWCCAGGTA